MKKHFNFQELVQYMVYLRKSEGYYAIYIDTAQCTSQEHLLQKLATALQYPWPHISNLKDFETNFLNFNLLNTNKIAIIFDNWADCLHNAPAFKCKFAERLEEKSVSFKQNGSDLLLIWNQSPESQLPRQGIHEIACDTELLFAYAFQLRLSIGYFVTSIDCTCCKTAKQFLHDVAIAFQFPPYYGENWDALEECLRDLSWLKFRGVAIILYHYEALFEKEPELKEKICGVLHAVHDFWKAYDIPFCAILQSGA